MKRIAKISGGTSLLLLATMLAGSRSARAAERVTLRNGSALVCDHQKNLDGQVRLYLTPSDENYLDVASADIVAVEFVRPAGRSADTFKGIRSFPGTTCSPGRYPCAAAAGGRRTSSRS